MRKNIFQLSRRKSIEISIGCGETSSIARGALNLNDVWKLICKNKKNMYFQVLKKYKEPIFRCILRSDFKLKWSSMRWSVEKI